MPETQITVETDIFYLSGLRGNGGGVEGVSEGKGERGVGVKGMTELKKIEE